jgi:DNA-binding transcriptional LysR family regulator
MDILFPTDVTMAAIAALQGEFPNTTISMATEALGSTLQPLIDGKDSFAVVGSLPQAPVGLVMERIRLVQMCLVAAPGHPLAQATEPVQLRELEKHIQIIVSDKTKLSSGRSFGVISPKTWSTAELTSKLDFLRSGFGWGFMPRHTVKSDLNSGRLVEVATTEQNHKDGWLPVALYIAYRRNRPPGRAAKWLIERLREGAGDISGDVFFRDD